MVQRQTAFVFEWSPSSRRAWIEINGYGANNNAGFRSPSSRRAWIEIKFANCIALRFVVALLTEGVD